MHLTEATWTDAADLDTDLALVPVGSTEQHGPHAPLGTDDLAARAVATRGADAYAAAHDTDLPVAPPITVGVAEEHRQFPGTLWVSPDTFRNYIREVVASLAAHGWNRVVLVNGHGGNVGALREVCGQIARHDDAYAVPFTWFEAAAESGEMGHGGGVETALLRAIRPDLVREERVAEALAGASERWGEWISSTNLAFDSAEFTDSGVVGDPRPSAKHADESLANDADEATADDTDGDATRGEELLDRATAALVALLEAVAERETARPEHR